MNVTHALTWGLSKLLGIDADPQVRHAQVEHLHWDRSERRWRAHGEDHGLGRDEAA